MNPIIPSNNSIASLLKPLTFTGWLEFIHLICSFSYECGREAYIDGLPLEFGVTLDFDEPQCLLAWEKGWIDESLKDCEIN